MVCKTLLGGFCSVARVNSAEKVWFEKLPAKRRPNLETDRQLSQHLKVDLADECHYARKQLALENIGFWNDKVLKVRSHKTDFMMSYFLPPWSCPSESWESGRALFQGVKA